VSCLSLLLGMGGDVFLDSWCVRTRGRAGWQMISGGRCYIGGNGDVCKVMVCKDCVFGGAIRAPLC
jgi:hypothetical protein